jgi:hypothetical protein
MSAMAAFQVPGPRAPKREDPAARPVPAEARVASIDAVLDPTGALWWPAEATLVVSDLHLETGSSLARRGMMLPPHDTAITLTRLADVFDRMRPGRVIALGDSFHDPFGAERLGEEHRATLARMTERAEFVWIAGNHDRIGAAGLGGMVCETLTVGGVTFRHIPRPGTPAAREVAGHLHPAARVGSVKRRCFVGCARRLVMPAFGALTGGLSVAHRVFGELWPEGPGPRLHLIGRDRVYSV